MTLLFHYLTLPYLLAGIRFTVFVTGLGLAGGLLLGTLLASMQLSRHTALAAIARGYATIFRGTPLILQMVFAYDALPTIGLKLSAVGAAGLALAANEAPFIAEILRAGVVGVDRGQVLAGQALGMTPGVLMRRVIAPQAIRVMVPALGSEAVSALKNSSLASTISAEELTLRSTQLASSTFDFFSIFFASGLIYLGLTGAITITQLLLERLLDLDRVPKADARRRIAGTSGAPQTRGTPAAQEAPVQIMPSHPGLLQEPPAPSMALRAHGPAKASPELTPAIRVTGLSKRHGTQEVLADLDLVVRAGEIVALLGPSGSGKSTLLRCISHLESWDAGQIHVGGKRLGYRPDGQLMNQRDLARERASVGVGMVFQQFNLFGHLSAQENVAGPLRWVHGLSRAAADRRALELLERVGLGQRVDALPRHLSGGQQQRVAIARALAPRPSVLLLDEPTSALDPELVTEVLDVIRKLAIEGDLAMVISTHQLRFAAEVAHRAIFLSGGKIIEDGAADQVLERPRHPLTARFIRALNPRDPVTTTDSESEVSPP